MTNEVSISCQKTQRLVYGVYPRIPPPQYTSDYNLSAAYNYSFTTRKQNLALCIAEMSTLSDYESLHALTERGITRQWDGQKVRFPFCELL